MKVIKKKAGYKTIKDIKSKMFKKGFTLKEYGAVIGEFFYQIYELTINRKNLKVYYKFYF